MDDFAPTQFMDLPRPRNGAPVPIPFPNADKLLRDREQRDRMERARDRVVTIGETSRNAAAVRAAHDAGRVHGYRAGYIKGAYWGLACGTIAGSFAGMGLVIGAIKLGLWVASR
jgi:hypothetical protein